MNKTNKLTSFFVWIRFFIGCSLFNCVCECAHETDIWKNINQILYLVILLLSDTFLMPFISPEERKKENIHKIVIGIVSHPVVQFSNEKVSKNMHFSCVLDTLKNGFLSIHQTIWHFVSIRFYVRSLAMYWMIDSYQFPTISINSQPISKSMPSQIQDSKTLLCVCVCMWYIFSTTMSFTFREVVNIFSKTQCRATLLNHFYLNKCENSRDISSPILHYEYINPFIYLYTSTTSDFQYITLLWIMSANWMKHTTTNIIRNKMKCHCLLTNGERIDVLQCV